jgi:hypothetical protein
MSGIRSVGVVVVASLSRGATGGSNEVATDGGVGGTIMATARSASFAALLGVASIRRSGCRGRLGTGDGDRTRRVLVTSGDCGTVAARSGIGGNSGASSGCERDGVDGTLERVALELDSPSRSVSDHPLQSSSVPKGSSARVLSRRPSGAAVVVVAGTVVGAVVVGT